MTTEIDYWDMVSDWNFHLDKVREEDSFTDTEKKEILSELEKLRFFIDDKWLKDNVKGLHPLTGYFTNLAPWTLRWLAELGRKLEAINEEPKSYELITRLKQERQYSSALAEIEVAMKLKDADFKIALFPKLEGKEQSPDMKAEIGGESIYFEVKTLGTPQEIYKAQETMRSLLFPVYSPQGILIRGQIFKPLPFHTHHLTIR